MEKLDSELAWFNWASLYGLLNFCREYVPAFAKLVKPLCQLLGQDAQPWNASSWGICVREVVWHVVTVLAAGLMQTLWLSYEWRPEYPAAA